MKTKMILAALACAACACSARADVDALREKIAKEHKILGEETWFGGHRIRFDFGGRVAWVVAPAGETAKGVPWTWTMQWADAYVDRTGVPDLLQRGFHHVTLDLLELLQIVDERWRMASPVYNFSSSDSTM